MDVVVEWGGEVEESESQESLLTQRTRKGKTVTPEAGVDQADDSSRSVYLDEDEGIWKCQHCSWTYRMGSPGIDLVHSHEEYFRRLVNAKTLSQQGLCFVSQDEGTKSADETAGTKFRNVGLYHGEKNEGNGEVDLETKIFESVNSLSNVANNKSPMDMRAESQLGLTETTNSTRGIESIDENLGMEPRTNGLYSCKENPQTDETDFAKKKFETIDASSGDECKSPMNITAEIQLDAEFLYSKGYVENGATRFEPVKEDTGASSHGKPIVEMDVERVLEEQETHDLLCPNCHSCITKKVILRKREQIHQDVQFDTKRKTIEPVLRPDPNASPAAAAAANETSHDTCPDVFRCLSCFSIFIPTGSGFKLFRIFGGNDEDKLFRIFGGNDEVGKSQSPQQIPAENLNWISSIFKSFKAKKIRNEPGNETAQHIQEDNIQPLGQSQHPDETLTNDKNVSQIGGPTLDESNVNVEESVDAEIRKPSQDGGVDMLLTEPGPRETQIDNGFILDGAMKTNGSGNNKMQHVVSNHPNLMGTLRHLEETVPYEKNDNVPSIVTAGLAQIISFNSREQGDNPKPKSSEDEMSYPILPKPSVLPHGVTEFDNTEELKGAPKANIAEDDMIKPAEEGTVAPAGTTSSKSSQNVPSPAAPRVLAGSETKIDIPQQKVDKPRRHEWDILKSIVYGGLVESITSLGVVASAAGSDASTLNIVALGLANLVGGLFVIAHNLRELKKEQSGITNQGEEELDRYQETLGHRENFWRHAVFVVLSYIIFGLIPPVIYGFSFRESENQENKLVAVAAGSLLCIALLAIGKARVQKEPKAYIKTVLYYISTGVVASGLSYVLGELINKLLQKLGWFTSSVSASPSAFLETKSVISGWASY